MKPRYRLIDKDGNPVGIFDTANEAALEAKRRWPEQEQDEEHNGTGWDVQAWPPFGGDDA